MFKLQMLTLLAIFIIGQASAQEAKLSLLDDEAPTTSTAQPQKSDNSSTDKAAEAPQKERTFSEVLFNFLGMNIPENIPGAQKPLPKDLNENSLTVITRKADDGDVDSQLRLAYTYMYGADNIPTDYSKAFHYYEMAARQSDPTALNNLGTLYYNGIGITRNTAKAIELFTQAAKQKNYEAATNLGFIYVSGNGAPKDIGKGLQYFAQAVEGDNVLAKFMLGYAYYQGKYISQDYTKAAPYIKTAADAGFDEAQVLLADLYIFGHGYPQNYVSAVKYLNKAVAQGNVSAMLRLADIYSGSIKYPTNMPAAHTLYNLAYVRGISAAKSRLDTLQAHMQIEELMDAQQSASDYVAKPSPLTEYVHKTFGNDIISYLK